MNFVEDYINECIDEGIVSPKDICQKVNKEIEEIDNQIRKYQELQSKKSNLIQVLRAFDNDKGKCKNRRVRQPFVNQSITEGSLDELSYQIINIINVSLHPITPRQLMQELGFDKDDPTPLYTAIKLLYNKGIIKRNEDRTICKGPNWESEN